MGNKLLRLKGRIIKKRKALAFIIDYVTILYIVQIPFMIIDMQLNYLFEEIYLYMIIVIILMFSRDVVFSNKSIGKKVMNLEIYDKNNKKIADKKLLIDRVYYSVFWTFPFYIFMILVNNKSSGDNKFNTTIK